MTILTPEEPFDASHLYPVHMNEAKDPPKITFRPDINTQEALASIATSIEKKGVPMPSIQKIISFALIRYAGELKHDLETE